jgi:hypothetical protein
MTRSNGVVIESLQGRLHWNGLDVQHGKNHDDEITDHY